MELGLLWDPAVKVLVASGRSEQEGRGRQETPEDVPGQLELGENRGEGCEKVK